MKTRNVFLTITLFMLGSLGLSQKAHAQQAVTEVTHVHAFAGWYLVEIKDTNNDIMGFWGIPRVEIAVGNIRRLWFELLPNDEWDVWAFEPVAIHEKMTELAIDGANQSSLDLLIQQEGDASDNQLNLNIDGGISGKVLKGFIEGDPLAESAGAVADPQPMIDLLAVVGYAVAPGISDLLVAGTAGLNMTMSATVADALSCMTVDYGTMCADCVCTRAGGSIESTPWEITEKWVDLNTRLRCTYERTETHSYWKTGIDPDSCVSCREGSAEFPIERTIERRIVNHWYELTECPDNPVVVP